MAANKEKKAQKRKEQAEEDSAALYRCGCGHRWKGPVNRDSICSKCGEIQGPVVII